MKRRIISSIVMAAAAFFLCACGAPQIRKVDTSTIPMQKASRPVTPGSIWPGENSRNTLFNDLRARNVGDVVTIEVAEKTSAIKEATTSTARDSSDEIAIKKLLGLPLNFGARNFLNQGKPFSPEISSSYKSKFDGSGTTKRSGELSATIAARVVEVLPNGNLVLEGKKDTIVNNELQYLVLTGIVRPEDITEINTVSSTLISDARIEYSGKGVLADEQKPGWLRRILDNIWPF